MVLAVKFVRKLYKKLYTLPITLKIPIYAHGTYFTIYPHNYHLRSSRLLHYILEVDYVEWHLYINHLHHLLNIMQCMSLCNFMLDCSCGNPHHQPWCNSYIYTLRHLSLILMWLSFSISERNIISWHLNLKHNYCVWESLYRIAGFFEDKKNCCFHRYYVYS